MTDIEICVGCGQRPTLALAGAAVLVVARDHRGVTTALCRRCGAGEDQEDAVTDETKKGQR